MKIFNFFLFFGTFAALRLAGHYLDNAYVSLAAIPACVVVALALYITQRKRDK